MINTNKTVYEIDLYLSYLRVPYYYHNKQLLSPEDNELVSIHNGQGIFSL
jgi:hypothetical protein